MTKKIKSVGFDPINVENLYSLSYFNDTANNTIFNGDVKFTTNIFNSSLNNKSRYITTSKNITLLDFNVSDLSELDKIIKIQTKLKLNYDKTNLSNYATYGSLIEKFRFSINNIINTFVGGLNINSYNSGTIYYTILGYSYDANTNISSFKIPYNVIENPFGLQLFDNNNLTSNTISNFVKRYTDYVLTFENINYGILAFTGLSKTNSSFLYFEIDGDPFNNTGNLNPNFLIKPNDIEFNKFYDNLSDLERYLLNKNSTPLYTAKFKVPAFDDGEDYVTYQDLFLTFPLLDDYNIDIQSFTYQTYVEDLFKIGQIMDDFKSNLIIRKLIMNNILELDSTTNFKSDVILKIYGKELDEIKSFFDSLLTFNNVSYDKVDNIPDILIRNLAKTLGWNSTNIISDKDLIKSVFSNEKTNGVDINASLFEVDTELWRRLIINTSFFLKSKGTRKAIETLFSFIGAPDCLIDFNEHVYVVEEPIDTKTVPIIFNFDKQPYDANGFPVAYTESSELYFQQSGNTDSGQAYINTYRQLGYNVVKTIDNKKSWVYYESANTHSYTAKNTNYTINDSRLIINTKEVSISLDIAKAIECDVYNFNVTNNYPVSFSGRPFPYPDFNSNKFNVANLTFSEYITEIYSKFINAKNRKVTDSAIGSSYPTLSKLYYDYYYNSLSDIGQLSNKRNFRNILDYIYNIDSIWNDFINQFIPATTIFNGSSSNNIRNTIFTPQKYPYKHGIDDGSEFQSDIIVPPESSNLNIINLETEFFDTIESSIELITITSDNINLEDTTNSISQNINLNPNYDSLICYKELPTVNLTGATKISLSTLTNNSLYNFSENTAHTINVQLTNVVSSITSNTNFNVMLLPYNTLISGFSITSSTLYEDLNFYSLNNIEILNSLIESDNEFILKPYFTTECVTPYTSITINTSYTMYDLFFISGYNQNYLNSERFFTFSGGQNISLTSFINSTSYTPTFLQYNEDYDYYFVSISDPDEPILLFQTNTGNGGLYVETITVDTDIFDKFSLTYEPVGDVIVAINGVTLATSEYENDTTLLIPSFIKRSFILDIPVSVNKNDIITVSYYRSETNANRLIRESFEYSGSPNIIYNTATTFYELHISENIVNSSDIVVFYNGLLIAKNSDYNISVYNNTISVISFVPQNGDIFTVFYETDGFSNSTTININTNPYSILWNIDKIIKPNNTGYFLHEFYSNSGFTGSSIYTAVTDYLYTTNSYAQLFDWSTTPLVPGQSYFYRLISHKIFKTINNINIIKEKNSIIYILKIPV